MNSIGAEEQPTFAIDHLYLAAYLVCSGHEVLRTSRQGGRVAFEFADMPELHADVAGFMSGASIPARQFCFELLKLKRMLNVGQYTVEKVNKNEKHPHEEIPR